jgi:hypothetical protein
VEKIIIIIVIINRLETELEKLCRLFDKELGIFDSFELSLQYCATVDCSTSIMVDLLAVLVIGRRLCAASNFYDDDNDDDAAAAGKWDLTTSVQLQLKGLEGTSAR